MLPSLFSIFRFACKKGTASFYRHFGHSLYPHLGDPFLKHTATRWIRRRIHWPGVWTDQSVICAKRHSKNDERRLKWKLQKSCTSEEMSNIQKLLKCTHLIFITSFVRSTFYFPFFLLSFSFFGEQNIFFGESKISYNTSEKCIA